MKNQTSYLNPFDGNYIVELAIPGYHTENIIIERIQENMMTVCAEPLTSNEASLVGRKQKFTIKNIPNEFDKENFSWFWLNGLFILVFKKKNTNHINRIKKLDDEMWTPWSI